MNRAILINEVEDLYLSNFDYEQGNLRLAYVLDNTCMAQQIVAGTYDQMSTIDLQLAYNTLSEYVFREQEIEAELDGRLTAIGFELGV